MLEILGGVGRRIGNWVERHSLPEPETRPMFTSFAPHITGDPFEGIFRSGALAASMARFRQEQTGPEGGTSQPDK